MFKSKTAPAPTLEEALAAAEAKKGAALSIFALAVDDLNAASAEALAVEEQIGEEIARLEEIREAARVTADASAIKATALADFIG